MFEFDDSAITISIKMSNLSIDKKILITWTGRQIRTVYVLNVETHTDPAAVFGFRRGARPPARLHGDAARRTALRPARPRRPAAVDRAVGYCYTGTYI